MSDHLPRSCCKAYNIFYLGKVGMYVLNGSEPHEYILICVLSDYVDTYFAQL